MEKLPDDYLSNPDGIEMISSQSDRFENWNNMYLRANKLSPKEKIQKKQIISVYR